MNTETNGRRASKCLGLFTRKERWGLSWRGVFVLGTGFLLIAYLLIIEIHPYLAVTERVDANYLVVEGWAHQFAAKVAANEFKSGAYQKVFITGLPVEGSGDFDGNDSDTEAYVGAGLVRRAGVPEEFIQRVPRHKVDRDRTYGSALALRAWIEEHGLPVQSVNIVTEAPHARRTRYLFQKALGPDVKVGIIAAQNPDYDPHHWWRYSEGVRDTIGETLAWLYAALIFHPATPSQHEPPSQPRPVP